MRNNKIIVKVGLIYKLLLGAPVDSVGTASNELKKGPGFNTQDNLVVRLAVSLA